MISQLERFVGQSYEYCDGEDWQIAVRLGKRTSKGEFSDSLTSEFFDSATMKLRSFPHWDGIDVHNDVSTTTWDHNGTTGVTTHGTHLIYSAMVVGEAMNVVCGATSDDIPFVFRAEVQAGSDFPSVASVVQAVHHVTWSEFRFKEYSIICETAKDSEFSRITVILRDPMQYLRRVGTDHVQSRAAASLATKINGLFDDGGPFT